jgi:predicted phosphodiesterase
MHNSRFADLSLWQSAVDEVVAREAASRQAAVPGGQPLLLRSHLGDVLVQRAAESVKAAEDVHDIHASVDKLRPAIQLPIQAEADVAAPPAPTGSNVVTYCADLLFKLEESKLLRRPEYVKYYQEILDMNEGVCDPRWALAVVKYLEFLASKRSIPYIRWKSISDFIIDGKLPSKARVAIIGDWGTGQPDAVTVLEQLARKKPDVVIHLGDVYYAGTSFEMENYFLAIWRSVLNLDTSPIPTFSLAGNHDMFSGGRPYYNLIEELGQPASYFCLRNDDWQFIAVDTGLHDSDPDGKTPTYLEDTEVEWLKDKLDNCGKRRTVLLSHHQLFSRFEGICGAAVNPHLNQQLSPLLAQIAMWIWGHEHNLAIYEKYMGILARLVGHGAFPVAVGEIRNPAPFPDVPTKNISLSGEPFLNHGYVLIDIDGPQAKVSYFVDSDEVNPQYVEEL